MKKIKVNKICLVNLIQVLVIFISFIVGFNFKISPNANTMPSTVLAMLTKVLTTNDIQNFFWLFAHNLTIMFAVFWVSYFSFGVVGTLWCVSNVFVAGILTKVYLTIINPLWLIILITILELGAAIITMISSTNLGFEKFKFKKTFKLCGSDKDSIKRSHEKNVLIVFAIIALLLFTSAVLEAILFNLLFNRL